MRDSGEGDRDLLQLTVLKVDAANLNNVVVKQSPQLFKEHWPAREKEGYYQNLPFFVRAQL